MLSCAECGVPATEVVCINCIMFGSGEDVLLASRKRTSDTLGTVAGLRQTVPEALSTAALLQSTHNSIVHTTNAEPDWDTIAAVQVR
jgi:hypothetical protein